MSDPTPIKTRRLTCIETFSGAGGMSLGLRKAGFDVRFAFDLNPAAVESYNKNIAPHCQVLDAKNVKGEFLLREAGLTERLDLLSGGPPCQGFSKQRRGAHLLTDERNSLVLEYARLVKETSARSFLFENVEIFGQKRGEDLIQEIREELSSYTIFTFFVCSSNFGLAQKRGRFIMIGVCNDEDIDFPVLEFSKTQSTVKDIIGMLPSPPEDYSEHPDFPNHMKCKISKLNEERFSHVPPGGGWKDIPMYLRLPCHQVTDVKKGGWPDVYGRLEWSGHCPTITAGFDSFTRGRYGHPEEHRAITLREGAMLQGFPDYFRFYGTRQDIRLQIGNAVPPPVAHAAGNAVARILLRQKYSAGVSQWPIEAQQKFDQKVLF
ncbi:DNA cytosine methyltransferase [Pseudomonas sp. S2_H08]